MENDIANQTIESTRQNVQIYLVGAGITFPEHLTIETIDVLTKCTRICTNLREVDLDGLPQDLRDKCLSLSSLYQAGRHRTENYLDVFQAIIEVAELGSPIAWLTPGHPVVFDSVSASLLKESKSRGWEVRVVPAISSVDTLLAELGYDPAGGLLIHEATALVKRRIPIIRSVAMMLLQPAVFDIDVAIITLSDNMALPDLSPLRDYLREYYPGDHECALVRSSSRISQRELVTWLKICDLASTPYDLVAGTTLFVPPYPTRRALS